ncbi:helix-turn-helix transcriptional regulator [Streptomyces sp. NPDC050636]|uniref:helix-turn-helix transcriptional regulator n=1 Tax=Streptomyces sp. NPDC050636 TaxID=3154510 RepID=UPI00342FAA9A
MQQDTAADAHKLFRHMMAGTDWNPDLARKELELTEDAFGAAQALLLDMGFIRPAVGAGTFVTVPPETAVAQLLTLEQHALRERLALNQELSQTLAALGSNLVTLQARAQSDTQLNLLIGEDTITAALHGAGIKAQNEILSMHPGSPLPQRMLQESMGRNQTALDRGVAMRAIHLNTMTGPPHGRAHLEALQQAGCEVRLASVLPFRMILVDNALAYMSAPPRDGQMAALEARGPDICLLLRQTFEHCWVHGTVPPDLGAGANDDHGPARELPMNEREIAVIKMMANGSKDDSIARALGVSSRTLRRMTTGIMEKLGSESRFAAGVKAAALGLIGTPEPESPHPLTPDSGR